MLITALALLVSVALAQDKPSAAKPPKKGDTVVVRGCITGGVIEAGELSSHDGEYTHLVPYDFRLTGKKEVLKAVKEEHLHHADAVTGVLKTDLPTERKGMSGRIGNTNVGIGMGPSQDYTQRAIPVLEVTSIEHVDVRCR
jgi:hypothetical protein